MNLLKEIRNKRNINEPMENLSSLYIELEYDFLKEPIIINFLLNTNIDPPIHFSLKSKQMLNQDLRTVEVFKSLFGESKSQDWLFEFIKFTHNFDLSSMNTSKILSSITNTKYKVKITLILFLTVAYNLIQSNFEITSKFLEKLFSRDYKYQEISALTNHESITLTMGLSLLYEFFEILSFYIDNYMMENKQPIKNRLYQEIETSITNYILMQKYKDVSKIDAKKTKKELFNDLFNLRCKRLNSTIFLLIDIGFSEDKFDQKALESSIALGRYIEIKMTLLRDRL